MLRDPRRGFLFVDVAPQQFLQRRRFPVGDAARHDQVEITQIRRHVVRKSVRSNPAADVHADRRQFFLGIPGPYPNSCFSGNALCRNPELGSRPDHRLFQHPYVPNHVTPDRAQVQDRISHNLSRPVIGNVSAAIRGMKLHALLPQHVFRRQQILPLAASPQRNHVRMLAKKEHILHRAGLPRSHKTLLQRVSFRVAYHSQINLERFRNFSIKRHDLPTPGGSQSLVLSS